MSSSKDVYSRKRIIAVTRLTIMKKYDYGHLEEIEVRREDQKLYKFREVLMKLVPAYLCSQSFWSKHKVEQTFIILHFLPKQSSCPHLESWRLGNRLMNYDLEEMDWKRQDAMNLNENEKVIQETGRKLQFEQESCGFDKTKVNAKIATKQGIFG
ncbi:hypothetical protein Tco_1320438 [Tanacetum coccineum]